MTSTTTRRPAHHPWPTRRERDGGPVLHATASAASRTGPRHAAADQDVTERLPIVVPGQSSAAGIAAARPTPVPRRPVPATPPPPRPAVGSAVRGPDGSDGRPGPVPRNGLGTAAACLGAIGLPLGLLPVTGFLAAGLGVLALVFGIAGWVRTRSRSATNTGTAVTGAVLGLVGLVLGVVGTVAFVRSPDRLGYDIDALTAPAAVVTQIGE